jgi:hypothetical protein
MDFSEIRRVRDELLQNRKYTIAAGVLAVAFFVVTVAGGVLVFRRAVADARPPVSSVVNVPTQVGLLFSYDNVNDVLNHIVFFNDVHLEAGPADNVYYAVGAAGHRVLVISEGSKAPSSENAEVNIKGTVRQLPSAATMKKKWKLDKDELAAAQKEGVYIEANEIIARRNTPSRLAKK